MTTTRSPADDARDLPREPTAPWILVLVAGLVVVWLGVLAWQVDVLPERVPTHFDSAGRADGWSSRTGALASSLLLPLLIALPLPLFSRLVLLWPAGISAPNRDWWTATAPRLRRFERLLREDLWLIAASVMVALIGVQVAITDAAVAGTDTLPSASSRGPLIVGAVGIGVVLVRVLGGRYVKRPDLV